MVAEDAKGAQPASRQGEGGKEAVEVLDAGGAAPGSRVLLEGQDPAIEPLPEIDAAAFFSAPLRAEGGAVLAGARRLLAGGAPISLSRVTEGEVG